MSSLSTSSPWLTHKISTFIPHTNFWHTFFLSLLLQRVCCGEGAAGGPGTPAAFPDGPEPWGPNDSNLPLKGWGREANKRRPSGPNRERSVNTVVICQCHQIQETVGKKDKRNREKLNTHKVWVQKSEVLQQVMLFSTTVVKWIYKMQLVVF